MARGAWCVVCCDVSCVVCRVLSCAVLSCCVSCCVCRAACVVLRVPGFMWPNAESHAPSLSLKGGFLFARNPSFFWRERFMLKNSKFCH
eukprot:15451474-Alexandrium_andersonii.AAC.1